MSTFDSGFEYRRQPAWPPSPPSPTPTPESSIFEAAASRIEAPSEFQTINKAVIDTLQSGNYQDFDEIVTGGGHGGFHVATVKIINPQTQVEETKKLFLKPFDSAEFNNFDFIQKRCQGREDESILKYMPRVYGEATLPLESGKMQRFMVMGNLFSTDDNKKWGQVADLKMTKGGQYDADELAATGRTKSLPDRALLTAQAALAPDYLTLHKSKIQRSLNAADSPGAFRENLRSAVANIPAKRLVGAIDGLLEQLTDLSNLIKHETSPMGFIGASIFIFLSKPETGRQEFKIFLADPAHGIAEPSAKGISSITDEQRKNMYWGKHPTQAVANNFQFAMQKKLNSEAIDAMKAVVQDFKKEIQRQPEVSRSRRQGPPPPFVRPNPPTARPQDIIPMKTFESNAPLELSIPKNDPKARSESPKKWKRVDAPDRSPTTQKAESAAKVSRQHSPRNPANEAAATWVKRGISPDLKAKLTKIESDVQKGVDSDADTEEL